MTIEVDVKTEQYRFFVRRQRSHWVKKHRLPLKKTVLLLEATEVTKDQKGTTYFWFLSQIVATLPANSPWEYELYTEINRAWSEANSEQAESRLHR